MYKKQGFIQNAIIYIYIYIYVPINVYEHILYVYAKMFKFQY